MGDCAFPVGCLTGPNKSGKSYTVVYRGKTIGFVNRKGLALLLEGKIRAVDIIDFRDRVLLEQFRRRETAQTTLQLADPDKIIVRMEPEP